MPTPPVTHANRQEADATGIAIAARRHPLVARVVARLRGPCGVAPPTRMCLGVSGGADSTALLLALTVWRDRHAAGEIELRVVHVNHHLRPEADNEAHAVVDLSDRIGVPCEIRHIEIDQSAAGNVEAAARTARYSVLADAAVEWRADVVAVAHNAEDQLETMLMALCRGAGPDGLSGMTWRRELGGRIDLVRPLLDTRHAECAGLCRAAGVTWIEDPSNQALERARARLRAHVLPVLDEMWPDAPRRAVSAGESVRAAMDAMELVLAQSFAAPSVRKWDRDSIATLPESLIAAGLRRAAMNAAPHLADRLGQRHLLRAARAIRDEERHPRRFTWPGRLVLVVSSRRVRLDAAGGGSQI